MTVRQGRRRKQLPDNFKERRRYCKFKDEALDHPVSRNRFRPVHGPVEDRLREDGYLAKSTSFAHPLGHHTTPPARHVARLTTQ